MGLSNEHLQALLEKEMGVLSRTPTVAALRTFPLFSGVVRRFATSCFLTGFIIYIPYVLGWVREAR